MSVSRLHHCPNQVNIAEGKDEPPAIKCRCRKYVSLHEATRMVKIGEASWIITKRTLAAIDEVCNLCHGDPEMKNCANCGGRGKVPGTVEVVEEGNDIVLVSRLPADIKEKKRSSALAMKTPRVATIEENHILLAFVEGVKEAAERIEEYGRMILEARMFVGPNKIPIIGAEPADNSRKHEGRNYDFGRAI